MKKISKIIITIILIVLVVITIFFLNKRENKKIYKEEIKENKFLTLMLEKEVGTGKYEESKENFPKEGYFFNEKLSKCENGSKIKYNEKDKTIDVYATKADKCYAYFDYDKLGSICRGQNMAECFTKNYKKDSTIIYHDGKADYVGEDNYELEAGDLSYRYAGANDIVNNFVCFASDTDVCPDNNLYRIIGLFKNNEGKYEIKLIKADYALEQEVGKYDCRPGSLPFATDTDKIKYIGKLEDIPLYLWGQNGISGNYWLLSNLNTINLNKNYLDNFLGNNTNTKENNPNKWQKMISLHSYIVGGVYSPYINSLYDGVQNAKVTYEHEIISPVENSQANTYIGLLYVSDYYYAADSLYWTKVGNDSKTDDPLNDYRSAINNNWLYLGISEWTITRIADNLGPAANIRNEGNVVGSGVNGVTYAIRPVFYISTDVKLILGSGTQENPYRIAQDKIIKSKNLF